MSEKKTFFANLEPKSALIVGVITGVLTLCTVGFVILLVVTLSGTSRAGENGKVEGGSPPASVEAAAPVATKSDRPKAELFVMSYCPYGLQMEKAFLPVMNLLKGKADLSIKFVNYAMHGLKELEENTREYCIQKEQPDKFVAYMSCFTGKDDYKACLVSAGVNQSKMNTCVTATDKQYKTLELYNDQSTWLSGSYPLYPVDDALNNQYGVQGSPTLVINGAEAQVNRTPEAVKQAICAAFKTAPAECGQSLSNVAAVAGFGTGTGADTGTATCE